MNPRWIMPDIKTFKVTELSTGLDSLRISTELRLKIDAELKALANSHDLPPTPEGTDMEAIEEFFVSLGDSVNHWWDPEEDFHRKGKMVHPEYQKKGFGTELTKYCNAISDKSGDRTWMPARPTSLGMFRKNGFKDIGFVDAHLERWGGSRDKSITWTLWRNPPSS